VFVALVLMRPSSWGARALQQAYDRSPTLRHGLICLLLLLGIGFAVNDSGTVVPAIGATLAIPLVLATSMRALEDDVRPDGEPAVTPDPAPAAARPAR
jgi:predicted tellurium resistance membrane protein TerC